MGITVEVRLVFDMMITPSQSLLVLLVQRVGRFDPELGEPAFGIPPETPFEDLPEEFICPICGASKEYFKEL